MKNRFFIFLLSLVFFLPGCEREAITIDDVDTSSPLPPAGVRIDRAEDGYILLSWHANAERDIDGYIIYRSEDANQTFQVIDTVRNAYFIDEHRSYDTTYFYCVTAIDESGNESARSVIVSARAENKNTPAVPKNFLVYGRNQSSGKYFLLEWKPNDESDLAGYKIYRSLSPTVKQESSFLLTQVNTAFYQDTSASLIGTSYYYAVAAIDRGGKESELSPMRTDVITEIPILVRPASFASVSLTQQLQFVWKASAGAGVYKLVVSTSEFSGEVTSFLVDPTGSGEQSLQYRGPSLSIGKLYYWRVYTLTVSTINPNAASEVRAFQIVE